MRTGTVVFITNAFLSRGSFPAISRSEHDLLRTFVSAYRHAKNIDFANHLKRWEKHLDWPLFPPPKRGANLYLVIYSLFRATAPTGSHNFETNKIIRP